MPIAVGGRAHRCRAHHRHDTPPAVAEDWRVYKTSGSVASRNRLIVYYMARHVRPIAAGVHAHLPQQVELDDLVQQGYFGLIDAMDRFDLDRQTRFETFSRSRIFGAIQDYLRSLDHVPRLTRSRSKQIQAVVDLFQKQFGRPPHEGELRKILNVPEPAFRRFLADLRPAATVAFSSVQPEGEMEVDGDADAMDAFEDAADPGPVRAAEKRDFQRWLTRGFGHRDRLIIILYYYEQMTMREIGRALGISESRVSQRLESILACLRSRLLATGAEQEFVFL